MPSSTPITTTSTDGACRRWLTAISPHAGWGGRRVNTLAYPVSDRFGQLRGS